MLSEFLLKNVLISSNHIFLCHSQVISKVEKSLHNIAKGRRRVIKAENSRENAQLIGFWDIYEKIRTAWKTKATIHKTDGKSPRALVVNRSYGEWN